MKVRAVISFLRSLEDHGGLDELTESSSMAGELLVEVSLHVLSFFIALGFKANFSLNVVVDGHGDNVSNFHLNRPTIIKSFHKFFAFFGVQARFSYCEITRHVHLHLLLIAFTSHFINGCHSFSKGVDHTDRSHAFDVKALPDGCSFLVFVFLVHVNELLVV